MVVSVSEKDHPSSGKGTDGRESIFVFGGLGWTDDTITQPYNLQL